MNTTQYFVCFDILTSMKGVALINAAAIIVFTDNFRRFSFNSRKICTYWGITSFRNESGDSIRRSTHTHKSYPLGLRPYCQRQFYVPSGIMNEWEPTSLGFYPKESIETLRSTTPRTSYWKLWLQWCEMATKVWWGLCSEFTKTLDIVNTYFNSKRIAKIWWIT